MNFMEEVIEAVEDKKSLNRTTQNSCESCGSDDIEEGKEVCEDCHQEVLGAPIL